MSRTRRWLARTDWVALLIGLLLVAKLLFARQLVFGSALGAGYWADLCAIIAIAVGAAVFGRRMRRPMLLGAAVVISLAMLTAVVYASYFNEVPSFAMLSMTGQLSAAGDGLQALMEWQYLLFVIDLPVLVFLLFKSRSTPPLRASILSTVGSVSVAVVVLFAFSATAQPRPLNAMRIPYQYGFVAYGIASSIAVPPSGTASAADERTLQDVIDELTGHEALGFRRPGSPATGSMRGKNLIVVQVEALQAGLVGARYEGQPVVPNLERFISESIYFPNTYSQIGRGNTSDAELVANTSLYPSVDEPSSVAYAKKAIPSLPRLLNAQGYKTMTMHTNDIAFWNRIQLYPALGFEEVYDRNYFGPGDGAPFGASDEVLYSRALQIMWAAQSERRPFYAHLITVSSHYPYRWAASRGALLMPGDVAKTETGKYLQAQSYADAQFGEFLDQLKTSGLLENSVVVVFGDHFGLRFDNDTSLDQNVRAKLFKHEYNRADFYNVPLAIRLPGGQAKKDVAVVGQIDIMPTMADLFGLDTSGMPLFGKSAFIDSPTLLTRPSSIPTYIDNEIMYLRGVTNGEDRWYSPQTQEMLAPREVPQRMDNSRRLLELSQSYASGLPEREDATDAVGRIPRSARDFENTPFR